MLEDYVFVGHAALDAWESTGEMRYYEAAEEIAASAVSKFYDEAGHGFFRYRARAEGEKRLGALTTRRKPLQDSPTPAGNPVAASLLLRLEALNGNAEYGVKAKQTLEAFAGIVEHFGLYAASYGLALQRMILPAVQVCVFGEDDVARSLEAAALARFAVNKTVIRLRRDQIAALPKMLAETLPHLPELHEEGSFAVVCAGNSCLPAVRDVDGLIQAARMGRSRTSSAPISSKLSFPIHRERQMRDGWGTRAALSATADSLRSDKQTLYAHCELTVRRSSTGLAQAGSTP